MTNVVAVTACISGIAHTYMAKQGLKKAAAKLGVEIKVETQGAMGIEGRLTPKDIAAADLVIFAVDTNVAERGRFDGKKIVNVGTNEVVKNSEAVLKRALEQVA